MNIPAEFNEIRPYTPEELPQIYEELIADPAFRTVVESVMPGVPFEGLAMKMRQCKTNLEFQKAFFYGLLWDLVKNSQRTDIRLFRLVRLNPELHFHLQSS